MKKIQMIFIGLFGLILFSFMIFTVTSKREISNVEKRRLAMFPDFSVRKVIKDEYYSQLTDAFSDQLFLRDYLVKGYYLMQFQRYLGDVVIGRDNEMFAAMAPERNKVGYKNQLVEISGNINDLNKELNENDAKLIFLSIPRKDAVMESYLPKTYTSSKDIYDFGVSVLKENLDESIYFVDGSKTFSDTSKKYYFKTDHHINPLGGELLYKDIMNIVSKDHKNVVTYELEDLYDVHKSLVNGAFNKQIGQSGTLVNEDLYLTLKKEFKYERYENDQLSNLKIWGSGNTYGQAYMEGDMAYTRVETNRKKLPNIMFVGSSFTNILEALSVPSFNRMVSIDYRHNTSGNSIVDYVKKYDIDYVVFVPSQSTDALAYTHIKLHLGLK